MVNDILTLEDVKAFTQHLIVEEKLILHPDDDFTQYMDIETKIPAYSAEEAHIRNQLMDKCFKVCDESGVSIYDFMNEIFLIETGLDKYIPLPSQIDNLQ